MGYATNPNGFLQFNNFEVPYENMLCRYNKVSPEGLYTKTKNEKIQYATMVGIRVKILSYAYFYLSAAATIAVRYSIVRRQFKDENNIERKIFDY